MIDDRTVCQDYIGKAKSKINEMDSLVNIARGKINDLCRGLNDHIGKPSSPTDGVEDKVNEALDNLDNINDHLGMADSAKNIMECLGISPSIDDLDTPGGLSKSELGSLSVKSELNKLKDALNGLLDPAENLIADAISDLEDALPLDLIDDALNLVQCLADCPGADGLPTHTSIEANLGRAGLNVNGEVDFSTDSISSRVPSIPTDKKDHYKKVSGMLGNVKKKSKDILKSF